MFATSCERIRDLSHWPPRVTAYRYRFTVATTANEDLGLSQFQSS